MSPMSWMEFVSSIVESLAWPLAIVTAVAVFRTEIEGLLKRLKSGKVLGTELVFGDALEQLERERATLEQKQPGGDQGDEPGRPQHEQPQEEHPVYGDERMAQLAREANQNPSYAIVTAFEILRGVSRDLIGLLERDSGKTARRSNTSDEVRMLEDWERKAGRSLDVSRLFRDLRDLRNRVAHGAENPTTGEAVTYVTNADFLASFLGHQIDSIVGQRN